MSNKKNQTNHPKLKMVEYIDTLGRKYTIETSYMKSENSVNLGFNPFDISKKGISNVKTQSAGASRLKGMKLIS